MGKEEVRAMKCDLPFYCQKIANIMQSQLTAMPKIKYYNITWIKRYGWTACLKDTEGGTYYVYPNGTVEYQENKLSAMAATTTDEEQHK